MSTVTSARRESARRNLGQFLKFAVVGGSGVVVNFAVALLMNKLNGGTAHSEDVLLPISGTRWNFRFSMLVWIVAFLIANTTNYQLNRSWTFKSGRHAGWWREFWPFFAVGLVAAVVGFFLKIAMKNPTSPFFLPEPWFNEEKGLQSREYWSHLIAIVLTIPINFLVNKFWTFRAVRHGDRVEDIPMVAPVVAPEVVDEDRDVLPEADDTPRG